MACQCPLARRDSHIAAVDRVVRLTRLARGWDGNDCMKRIASHLAALATLLSFLLIRTASLFATDTNEVLLKDIKYSYDREPENDPDHTALLDGKGAGPWAFTLTTDVTFDLKASYELTRVEADVYRGNLRWRIEDLSLFLMDRDGDFKQAGKVDAKMESDKPSPSNTLVFRDIHKTAQKVRLRFHNDGYYFGIVAVRFYARPMKVEELAPVNEKNDGPLTPYTIPDTGDALVFKKGNFDKDPEDELLLANKYVKMVIKPSIGGVIASFRYKGVDFTQPKVPSAPGGGGGFLADNINAQGGGDWWEAPYQYKVIENTADRISLQLWATGKTGPCAYLTVYKTITLYKDRSDVQVDWDYQLSKAATAAIPFRILNLNFVGTREGLTKSKNFSYFTPIDDGLARLDYGKQPGMETWWYNPTRGWVGAADTNRHMGVAFLMDYRYVKLFYSWGSTHHNGLPTLEWLFNDITIPDGGSFKTSATIVPFQGMDEIAGAGGGIVGDLKFADGKLTASLVSGRTQEVRAVLRERVLPTGEWKTILERKVSLKTDEPLPLTAEFKPAQDGTHVFSLVLKKDDKELFNTELAQVFGKASGKYVFKPTEERIVEEGSKVKTNYTSMDYETPHVKWVRPYHGGKTKALILVDGRYGREVIELAQRMDLKFDTTFLFPIDLRETLVDYYGRTSGGDLKAGLKRLFEENPEWEVIVMAGHMFRYFEPEQQADVLEKIKAGRGLVVVQPDASDPLPAISPLQKEGTQFIGKWETKQAHFITTGIPLEALPPTPVCFYAPSPGAEVLAVAKNENGQTPLVATATIGTGRVVAFGYRGGDTRPVKQFFGLTPFMADSQSVLDFASHPTFRYWEYHFSLLAKSVLWAAKKEPAVQIEKIEANSFGVPTSVGSGSQIPPKGGTTNALRLLLNNSGEKQSVTVEIKVQDKYGNSLGSETKKVELAAGKSEITIPVRAVLRDGANLFDVWLRDPQGKVVNWASASLQVSQPLKIASVDDGKKDLLHDGYKEGDTINLGIKLYGATSPGWTICTRIRDGFDRLIAEKKTAVESNNAKVSIKLEHLINRLLVVENELTQGDERADSHEFHRGVEFPISRHSHEDDPMYVGWNQITSCGVNNYLIEPLMDLLGSYGFNTALVMGNDYTPSCVASVWRRNMPIETRYGGIGPGSPRPGCDPEHMVLNYCMNDPKTRESESGCLGALANVGVSRFQYGDEFVFAGSGQDYCFCEFCMQKMRTWLQSKYAGLDALNKNWGTRFKTWNEVRPLTLKESHARSNGNFVSWADHRRFNEITVADYFSMMAGKANQIKPGARFGVSGNFGPSAYSGEDDWLLRNSWTQLEAYSAFDEFNCWQDDMNDMNVVKYGTFADADFIRSSIWYHTFFGINGMGICGTQRLPGMDWSTSNCASGYRDNWGILNRGIGRLLNEARRTAQPIAMLYSRNDAARAAFLIDQEKLWQDTRYHLTLTLDDSGFDKGWISYEQLEQGKADKLNVLWLPMACTLTEKEIAALKKFVENGGTLIGVMGIGIADSDCRILQQGSLDRVFGIKRSRVNFGKRQANAVRKNNSFGLSFPEIPLNYVELGLQADTAEVLAETKEEHVSIAFANQYGKGTAIYLACDLPSSFEQLRAARGVGDNARICDEIIGFVTDVHAKAGVPRVLEITDEAGKFPPYLKVVNFKQGAIDYYGILRDNPNARFFAKNAVKVQVRFPTKGYVRELIANRDLGQTDTLDTVFTATTLQLYSVLPYKVSSVAAHTDKTAYSAGETVNYNIAVIAKGKVGTHTLRLNVVDPSGVESKAYSLNLTARDGKTSGSFSLALNDKRGTWKLDVKDITSGRETSSSIVVR